MNGKDISLLRKKYFAHPVLLNSKIEADDGVDFTISIKYAGIDWIFFTKSKFVAFINKYDKQHKFVNPVKKNKSKDYKITPEGNKIRKISTRKKKPVSKKKAKRRK
ncbi:MAG: hypothetical protein IPL26_30025 [Leptospiraceae bacterium]|nr:hypothetical protein [Leptospiraceae bacterium]